MTNLPATTNLPKFSFATTIRPGLLVAVKTSIKGNVTYKKTDLGSRKLEDGTEEADWETKRKIKDAAEQDAASKCRSKARNLIGSVCSTTDFGYLCPLVAKPELEKAIIEAKALCDEFNKTSKYTKIRFGAVTGTIAQDDYQAVRALRREVNELLTDMQQGLENLDVGIVREAANRAKQLGQMLTQDAQVRLEIAIKAARDTAKRIVAAGDQGAVAIDRATLNTLTEARTAFLDLDTPEGAVAAPLVEGRAVDLTEGSREVTAAPAVATRQLDC